MEHDNFIQQVEDSILKQTYMELVRLHATDQTFEEWVKDVKQNEGK